MSINVFIMAGNREEIHEKPIYNRLDRIFTIDIATVFIVHVNIE